MAESDAGTLALELVADTVREIAEAIEYEINVRLCARRPADEIEALRWCLDLVRNA
jgi:hypothetical protein